MEGTRREEPKEVAIYDSAKRLIIDREITDKAKDFMSRKAKGKKPFFSVHPLHPDPYAGGAGARLGSRLKSKAFDIRSSACCL